MARFARIVVPGYPYHVTHRGNRREDVFYSTDDRDVYRKWLREYSDTFELEIWAYCLMCNHVHLLVLPHRDDSLALAIGHTHRRYAQWVNRQHGWSGHLWANRFHSTLLDNGHLWTAVKYVECNPVRARIVRRAEEYPWSSARAHSRGSADALLSPNRPFPNSERVGDWAAWLATALDEQSEATLRRNTQTGRPCGSTAFIEKLEEQEGRSLRPGKRGRRKDGES
jgi:putative transposase